MLSNYRAMRRVIVTLFCVLPTCGASIEPASAKCLEVFPAPQNPKWNGSALHKAVLDLSVTRVRQLLASDIGLLESKDNLGQTPLFYVVVGTASPPTMALPGKESLKEKRMHQIALQREIERKTAMLDILLGAGANTSAIDGSAMTPLMAAVLRSLPYQGNNSAVVSKLLQSGADINAQDKDGTSALMIASLRGNERMRLQLLKAGAKSDLKRCDGKTASDLAR